MLPISFIGTAELLIVVLIILILFGASRLPEIGKGLAGGISAFKKALNEPDKGKPSEKEDSSPDSDKTQ